MISYLPLPPSSRRNVPSGPFHWPSHLSVACSELATLELGALIEPESTLRSVHPKRISVNVRYPIRDRYLRFMRSWSCMTPRACPLTCGTRDHDTTEREGRARRATLPLDAAAGSRPCGCARRAPHGWSASLTRYRWRLASVANRAAPPLRKSPAGSAEIRCRPERGAPSRQTETSSGPAAALRGPAGPNPCWRHAETDQRQLVQRIDQALDVRGDDVAHAVGADLYPTRGRTEQQPSVDSRVGRKRGAKASSSGFQNVNERRVLTLSPSDSDSSPKTPKCREMAHVRVTGTIG